MQKIKIIVLSLVTLLAIAIVSAFTHDTSCVPESKTDSVQENGQDQTINLFVTHGHCSTPFGGIVDNLKIITPPGEGQGNPLENMKISFQIDPETFNVCANDDLTERIRTPGLFVGTNNEKIIFRSTKVYTMGVDWYQVNGILSIKGVENDVKFFVSGIKEPKDSMPSSLVLEGKLNLLDWGIDYDKIINGKSDPVPTKWMHINMKIKMS